MPCSSVDSSGAHIADIGAWGECPDTCDTCSAVSGPGAGAACVFPFTYQGEAFYGCTVRGSENGAAWCATEVSALDYSQYDDTYIYSASLLHSALYTLCIDLNRKDSNGWTGFHWANYMGRTNMIQIFMKLHCVEQCILIPCLTLLKRPPFRTNIIS